MTYAQPMDWRTRLSGYWWALPSLVAIAASIPCFAFTYLWDDYYFLNHALSLSPTDFLPTPRDPFYRPLSRGLYFQLLDLAGTAGPFTGHVLNACILATTVLLLVLLVGRLTGRRAAVYTGLVFSLLAPTPFLVGWISGVQDLLSMALVLAAFHFQLSGRTGAAVGAMALGILSKETAVVLAPALVALDWILGRRPYRIVNRLAAYGALIVAWILAHPGIRILLSRGFRSGATMYVGAEHPERWLPYAGRYVLTMLNVPTAPIDAPWLLHRAMAFVVIAGLAFLGLRTLERLEGAGDPPAGPGTPRLLLLACALSLPPLALTSTMLRVWVPYYAVYPAVGSSILLGVALARAPARWAGLGLALFLALGILCRGGRFHPGSPTEYNLSLTDPSLRAVEERFKALRPTLPKGAQVLVSVQAGGMSGLYTHMYLFQALRVWYRDPTLRTMRPDWRSRFQSPELLFWVSPREEVFEIDTRSLVPRTAGPEPDVGEYRKTLRYYARGLGATGETDRGLGILLTLPEHDLENVALDRRLAAMLLFQEGRDGGALEILRHVPPIYRSNALQVVGALLASPGGPRPWDDAAFRAFGLNPADADAWRALMRGSDNPLYASDALRYANRLLQLVPGDPEALATLRTARTYIELAPIATPAPPD